MSRGPGRIERATHPDLAFVTDELIEHCYPDAEQLNDRERRIAALLAQWGDATCSDPAMTERVRQRWHEGAERRVGPGVLEFPRKYQVAVLRAAKKVVARDPDWTARESESQGGTWVFFNRANVQSYGLAMLISDYREVYRSPKRIRRRGRAAERYHCP